VKNLRYLIENLSAVQTIEDVKQVLKRIRDALVQFDQQQQITNVTVTEQLDSITGDIPDPSTLYLMDDAGYFIKDNDGQLIEIEE